jgi:hypothetical protein
MACFVIADFWGKTMEMKSRLACLSSFLLLAPVALQAEDIDWMVAPYGWLPSITLDQSGGDPANGGGGGLSGNSLLDMTDSFFKFRAEAARKRWGLSFDYITLSLSDETTLTARPPLNLAIDIEAELDLDVLEFGAFYRPSGEIAGLNYLLGIRQISADKTLFIMPSIGPAQRVDTDAEVTDVYLGARYLHQFSDRWSGAIRGDYSFGDSEGTLNLLASVGFHVAGAFSLQGGYRHAVIEFEVDQAGDTVNTEIELSGPFVGLVFRF